MTKVYAPDLYPRKRNKRYTSQRDQFLREAKGVDPTILAEALGLSERFVIHYQRKLGVRPLTGNGR